MAMAMVMVMIVVPVLAATGFMVIFAEEEIVMIVMQL
jgi:hypothetical protein